MCNDYGNQTVIFCFYVYGVLHMFKNHLCLKNKNFLSLGSNKVPKRYKYLKDIFLNSAHLKRYFDYGYWSIHHIYISSRICCILQVIIITIAITKS